MRQLIITLGGPLLKTLALIVIMLVLLTAMSVRAEEKPLVLKFVGKDYYVTFHCVFDKNKELACVEKTKKKYSDAEKFWSKFINHKL